MARTARTAATVATIARKAGATVARKAPARDATAPAANPIFVVSIDGAAPVPVPFKLGDFVSPGDFALDVIAALAWAQTGRLVTSISSVGGARGFYSGTFNCGRGAKVQFAFGALALVEAYRAKRNEAAAIDAPATAPAKPAPISAEPAPAKPARTKATPQIAPIAGMTPLGLKPAAPAAPAREPKRLPAPDVASAMKATAAAARDVRSVVMVRVTVEGHGAFDVHCARADMAEPANFVRQHVAARVAAFHEWPRVAVDYASRGSASDYLGAVSYGGKRQGIVWCECPATASAPALPLPARVGMGNAPRLPAPIGADALAARMGIKPAGAAVAAAEAKAAQAGIKLSRADRQLAEAADAAAARRGSPIAASHIEAAPKMSASTRAMFEAAAKGTLPAAPDFTADTHTRYRPKLAELVALVRKGDVAGLKAYYINPISTSPKALNRYRNAAVIALTVKADKKAARAAA